MRPVIITILLTLATAASAQSSNPKADSIAVAALLTKASAFEQQNELDSAIGVARRALLIKPGAALENQIALLYGKKGDNEKEVEWAKRALESDPNSARAYLTYGMALDAMNDPSTADEKFELARTLAPSDPFVPFTLGVREEGRSNIAKAIELYTSALAIDPKYQTAYYNLAMLYATKGQYGEAMSYLEKLLTIAPDDEQARTVLEEMKQEHGGGANKR